MLILLSLILLGTPDQTPPAQAPKATTADQSAPAEATTTNQTSPAPQPEVATVFKTSRTLPELEKCLTDKLSAVGEVTSVPIEGTKTLMFRTVDEPPMLIDIAPPTVKVSTKFALWTRPIIETCL